MARDNGAFQISEETRKLTAKCPFNIECMVNRNWDTCSIARKLQNISLFIAKKCNKSNCPYSLSFGKTYLCQCPIRREIYQRYNI